MFEFLMSHKEELTVLAALSTILGNLACFLYWLWKRLNEHFYF